MYHADYGLLNLELTNYFNNINLPSGYLEIKAGDDDYLNWRKCAANAENHCKNHLQKCTLLRETLWETRSPANWQEVGSVLWPPTSSNHTLSYPECTSWQSSPVVYKCMVPGSSILHVKIVWISLHLSSHLHPSWHSSN